MADQIVKVASDSEYTIHERIRIDRDTTIIQNGFVWSDLITFKDYANGKQAVVLSDKQKEILKNLNYNMFCDNVCHQILSETIGRVQFQGWKCNKVETQKWLSQFFKLAKIARRQNDFHFRSLRDGNFAVSVNWDNKKKRVQVYKEPWWDGISGVYLHYDDAGNVEYAVKEWCKEIMVKQDGGGSVPTFVWRRLIWFEDRIERWEGSQVTGLSGSNNNSAQTWYPISLPEDRGQWPVPWVDKNGEPLGIPFVHFPNVGKTYGDYGVSELDGGIIGYQDQLNDAQLSITSTIRMTGGQMYYGTGVKTPLKPDKTPAPIKVEAGMFLTTENENAKFGILPAGDISKQIEGYNLKLKRVSQMASIPHHVITGGDWPSGEALLRAEAPAVNKAWRQIEQYSVSWTEVATTVMRIHNRFKAPNDPVIDANLEDDTFIETVFADPEKRDAISKSIIVHNLASNISKKEALRIMGYTDQQVEVVYQEIVDESTEAADQMTKVLMARQPAGTMGNNNPANNKKAEGGNNNIKSTGTSGN